MRNAQRIFFFFFCGEIHDQSRIILDFLFLIQTRPYLRSTLKLLRYSRCIIYLAIRYWGKTCLCIKDTRNSLKHTNSYLIVFIRLFQLCIYYPTNHCHVSIIMFKKYMYRMIRSIVVSRSVDVIIFDAYLIIKGRLTDAAFKTKMFEFQIFYVF